MQTVDGPYTMACTDVEQTFVIPPMHHTAATGASLPTPMGSLFVSTSCVDTEPPPHVALTNLRSSIRSRTLKGYTGMTSGCTTCHGTLWDPLGAAKHHSTMSMNQGSTKLANRKRAKRDVSASHRSSSTAPEFETDRVWSCRVLCWHQIPGEISEAVVWCDISCTVDCCDFWAQAPCQLHQVLQVHRRTATHCSCLQSLLKIYVLIHHSVCSKDAGPSGTSAPTVAPILCMCGLAACSFAGGSSLNVDVLYHVFARVCAVQTSCIIYLCGMSECWARAAHQLLSLIHI